MEDKYEILEHLLNALQLTRQCRDLIDLDYDVQTQTVTAHFDGGHKRINVAMDSGIAMIKDVVQGVS